MASKHLSEDEIKYVINADSSKAQQELHKLEKETSSLRTEEKRRKSAMVDLEAAGKKNTEEYKHLSEECKDYSSKIRDNEKKMRSMRSEMDANVMTMNELKKHSKDLHRELDNMSKSANPKEYAELESRLKDVDGRISELKQDAKGFSEIATSDITTGNLLASVYVKAAELIGTAFQKITGSIQENINAGLEMAESADGITHAFKQLNKPDLLSSLRKATKGTVNDVELMKAAVKAKDFRIPLEDLGKYLSFAQLKAQQTGQSLDYMVDSIVTGLGRKSPMILDNLGLSAAEISEKTKQTGDFMKAVASIVENQLSSAGETYISAADKAAQRTTDLQNAQKNLGDAMLPLKEEYDDVYGEIQIRTIDVIKFMVEHRSVVFSLVAALSALSIATALQTGVLKNNIVVTKGAAVAQALWNTVTTTTKGLLIVLQSGFFLLTGNVTKAKAAWAGLNSTMKSNLIYLAVAALAAGAVALYEWKKRADAAAHSQSLLSRLAKEGEEAAIGETSKLKVLYKATQNHTLSMKERLSAAKELQKNYPSYFSKLTTEAILAGKAAAQYRQLTADIIASAKARVYQDEIAKLEKQNYEHERGANADKNWSNRNKNKYQSAKGSLQHNIDYTSSVTSGTSAFTESSMVVQGAAATKDPIIDQYETRQTRLKNHLKKIDDNNRIIEVLAKRIASTHFVPEVQSDGGGGGDVPTGKSNSNGDTTNTPNPDETASSAFETARESDIDKEKKYYQEEQNALNEALATKQLSQEKFDTLQSVIKVNHQQNLLDIEKSYQQKAQEIQIKDADKKAKLQQQQDKNVAQADQETKDAELEAAKQYYDSITDMQSMSAKETTPTLQQELDAKLLALDAYYKTSLERARLSGQSEADATKAYEDVKASIKAEYAKKELEQQNANKEKINQEKQQLGLVSQKDLYDQELAQLRQHLEEVKATEEESAKAVTDLKVKQWKEQFDYYSSIFSSSFTSLQDAELAVVDAKYDAELQSAKGNSEKTEMLEKKKANAELKVKKKFADVNFAITAAQIIANTAAGVAYQFTHLPLAAAIATGVLVSAAGTAQLVAANAEREKVKKMSLESTGSSSSSSGARVATGRESGGNIDVQREQDGKLFNAQYDPNKRGYIDRPTVIVGEGPYGQSKEWVASNAALNNPTIAPIIDIIDQHQRAGTLQMLDMNKYLLQQQNRGLSSGGYVSPQSDTSASNTSNNQLIEKFYKLLLSLQENGIPATVALDDFDAKQKLRDQARKMASK